MTGVPALVLTAGLATRLRPLSLVRAKAALPVAGEPIVHRILRWLKDAGVTDAVLNLHHLPHTLTGLVGDGAELGMRVRYSWETPVLGSAGGPRRAIPLLRPPSCPSSSPLTFLIVNGDTLTDANVDAAIAEHRATGALVTMMVVPNAEPDKYGGLAVDASGNVTGFVKRGATEPSFHFIGVQVAEAAAFSNAPVDTPSEVRDLYLDLIAERLGSVRAFRCAAEFFDIGTPADYLQTSLRIGERERRNSTGRGARVDPGARVERSILWDDVVIESGALLRECVVADGVTVPADTSWHGVTIRNASGELAPGERRVEHLAIASL
jgi:NDP-sugar pyrophosphorylase family protein